MTADDPRGSSMSIASIEMSLDELSERTSLTFTSRFTKSFGQSFGQSFSSIGFNTSFTKSIMQRSTNMFASVGSSVRSVFGWTERRRSSMMKWATLRRLSSTHERVGDEHVYIAESKWGIMIERILMPFTPSSIASLGIFLGFFSILLTAPLLESRVRYGKWKGHFPIQVAVNTFFRLVGWKEPLDSIYLEYGTDEENPTRPGIDKAFFLHASFGLLWVLVGSTQIAMFQRWTLRWHRRVGYLSATVFVIHFLAGLHILYRDIVHHNALVKALLVSDLVSSTCYIVLGILRARKKDKEGHQDMMMWGYLHAIEGSGTIRFTGYLLWLMSQPFSSKIQSTFVTSTCQHQFIDANAGQCVFPYTFRLQVLRILTYYFYGLYLRTPEKSKDLSSRRSLAKTVQESFVFLFIVTLTIFLLFEAHRVEFLRRALSHGDSLQITMVSLYTAANIYKRSLHARRFMVMPRRNAVRESSAARAEQVAAWYKSRDKDDDKQD